MRFFTAVFCLILLIITNDALSQGRGRQPRSYPGKITGKVIDEATQEPIRYATISLLNPKDSSVITGGISKKQGVFYVDNIPLGQYLLKCTYIGYDNHMNADFKLGSEKHEIDLGIISLAPVSVTSEGVEITADKDLISYNLDKKVVNVSQNLVAQGGTAADALQNVPSVRVDLEGNVSLRGSTSYTVLIDGRPTALSGNDLLKQLPAAAIENIEIITNPSAKYDPDGTAGIINIIMKKQSKAGMNGIINLTAGTRDKYNGSTLINFRNEKFNFFIGGDYNDQKYHPYSKFTRETYAGGDTLFVVPEMFRTINPISWVLKGGADYNPTDKSALSLSANYGYYGFDRLFPSNYHEWTSPSGTANFFRADDDYLVGGDYYSTNLNYLLQFEKDRHDLNMNFNFSGWNGEVEQETWKAQSEESFNTIGNLINKHKTFNDLGRMDIRYKMDYQLPLSEDSKFEMGFQSDALWKDSDFRYDDLDVAANTWIPNAEFTNQTDFIQTIQALYATYSNSLFGLGFQIGLRGEYYYRNLEQLTSGEDFKFDQYNLFPSAHISKELGETHQLQLSYSRRVRRPDDRSLNPFPDYSDDYFISKGNPYLKPQFTNSFELNYRKSFESSFISLETYYRQTDDLISRTLKLQEDNKILISAHNVNKDYLYGMELAANFTVAKWFRFNASSNYYNYNLEEVSEGQIVKRNSDVFDANLVLTFILSQATFIQMTGYYTGPKIIADGEQEDYFTTFLSLRQDLFDRKLSVILNVRDIFATARYEFSNSGINYSSYGYFDQEAQTVTLTLSYRINNYQRRQQRDDSPDIGIEGGM